MEMSGIKLVSNRALQGGRSAQGLVPRVSSALRTPPWAIFDSSLWDEMRREPELDAITVNPQAVGEHFCDAAG